MPKSEHLITPSNRDEYERVRLNNLSEFLRNNTTHLGHQPDFTGLIPVMSLDLSLKYGSYAGYTLGIYLAKRGKGWSYYFALFNRSNSWALKNVIRNLFRPSLRSRATPMRGIHARAAPFQASRLGDFRDDSPRHISCVNPDLFHHFQKKGVVPHITGADLTAVCDISNRDNTRKTQLPRLKRPHVNKIAFMTFVEQVIRLSRHQKDKFVAQCTLYPFLTEDDLFSEDFMLSSWTPESSRTLSKDYLNMLAHRMTTHMNPDVMEVMFEYGPVTDLAQSCASPLNIVTTDSLVSPKSAFDIRHF